MRCGARGAPRSVQLRALALRHRRAAVGTPAHVILHDSGTAFDSPPGRQSWHPRRVPARCGPSCEAAGGGSPRTPEGTCERLAEASPVADPPGPGLGARAGVPARRGRAGGVVPAGQRARPPARDRRGGGMAGAGTARRRAVPLPLHRGPRRGVAGVQHHPPRRGRGRAVPARAHRPRGRRAGVRPAQPHPSRRLDRVRPGRRGRERGRQRAPRRRPHPPPAGDPRRALRRPRPAAHPVPGRPAAAGREHPPVLAAGHGAQRPGRLREVLDRRGLLRPRPHARGLPRGGLGGARAPGGRLSGDPPGPGGGPRGAPAGSLGGVRSRGAGAGRPDGRRGRLRPLARGLLRLHDPLRVPARGKRPQPGPGIGRGARHHGRGRRRALAALGRGPAPRRPARAARRAQHLRGGHPPAPAGRPGEREPPRARGLVRGRLHADGRPAARRRRAPRDPGGAAIELRASWSRGSSRRPTPGASRSPPGPSARPPGRWPSP